MQTDLENGIVDMIIGGPASRPEFAGLTLVEIGERGYCLIARVEDSRYQTAEDALQPGVLFTVIEGTDVAYYLESNQPQVELQTKSVAILEETVGAVRAGEADVTAAYSLVTPALLAKYPELKAFPDGCIEEPLWSTTWGISIRADDPLFQEFLEGLVASLRETGWFEERAEQWVSSPILMETLDIR
jgi:hypothetical protein